MSTASDDKPVVLNSPRKILMASLIGTTIEYFDFYIFGTAAVLVFPHLFFAASDPSVAILQSLATFGLAFVARPVGSALFGHFGDRIGRKATLVASLLTMGVSTVAIGLLPSYAAIGIAAPILLAVCRFGQGLGLGGEWGGAILLATENAPANKRALYGSVPQLGGPIGFFLSGSVFLVLTTQMTEADFLAWGWRIPFVASALLVLVGLYVRLNISETPQFQKVMDQKARVNVPIVTVFTKHTRLGAIRVVLPDHGVHPQLGHQFLGLPTARFLGAATHCGGFLRHLHSHCRQNVRQARSHHGPHLGRVRHCGVGLVLGPDVASGQLHHGVGFVYWHGAHGHVLWPLGLSDGRAVSHRSALHRRFVELQFIGHLGRFVCALHRHLAGHQPWPAIRGLLPVGHGQHQCVGTDGGEETHGPCLKKFKSALAF